MNDPISLPDSLLSRGRHLSEIGQTADARRALVRLLARPELRDSIRVEAHRLLGDLEAGLGNYRKARRHFAVVFGLRPDDAEAYVAYAAAVDADPDADPREGLGGSPASDWRIDPFEPRYWTALGRSGMRVGNLAVALKAFRKAARLRPDRIDTLSEIVDGFLALGREDEARDLLTAARFQFAPAAIADLWSRFRYECARREQERNRRATSADEVVVLPFPGRTAAAPSADASPVVIRADRRSRPVPHVLRLFGMRSDPRRAN